MPPSSESEATPAPAPGRIGNDGVRIWIPLPVAVLGALLAVLAVLLVLGPTLAGSILVVGFFGLFPGLAVVRLLGLRDAPLELVLGFALSFAVAGLISVTQAYFGGWSPMLTLGALVGITVLAILAPFVASLVRMQRRRSSVAEGQVAAPPVAWPSAAAPSVAAPSVAAPRAVASRPRFAPLVTLPGLVTPAAPPVIAPSSVTPTPVPPIASPPAVVTSAAPPAPAPVGSADPVSPPARSGRGRSRATSDLPPPPPVAVIRKRPKAGSAATAGGAGPESRPSRAARATIDQLVDDLADQRDGTSS